MLEQKGIGQRRDQTGHQLRGLDLRHSHLQSTNGYEQRRQAALAMGIGEIESGGGG